MNIESLLSGGNPRSLGRTVEVIELVEAHPARVRELFECLWSKDEIVRMRASDALEKICREHPQRLQPYVPRLLHEVSGISQSSVQWHLAQMLSEVSLTPTQQGRAVTILRRNLDTSTDWIVINLTLEALAYFTRRGALSRQEFAELLKDYTKDRRKSVASRSIKLLAEFTV